MAQKPNAVGVLRVVYVEGPESARRSQPACFSALRLHLFRATPNHLPYAPLNLCARVRNLNRFKKYKHNFQYWVSILARKVSQRFRNRIASRLQLFY